MLAVSGIRLPRSGTLPHSGHLWGSWSIFRSPHTRNEQNYIFSSRNGHRNYSPPALVPRVPPTPFNKWLLSSKPHGSARPVSHDHTICSINTVHCRPSNSWTFGGKGGASACLLCTKECQHCSEGQRNCPVSTGESQSWWRVYIFFRRCMSLYSSLLISHNLFFKKMILFMYQLCCVFCYCVGFSLAVGSRGYSLVALCGLLIVVGSLTAEHGL